MFSVNIEIIKQKKDTFDGHERQVIKKMFSVPDFKIGHHLDLRSIRDLIQQIISFLISAIVQIAIHKKKQNCPYCQHPHSKPTGERKETSVPTSLCTIQVTRDRQRCKRCGHRFWNIEQKVFEGGSVDFQELQADANLVDSYQRSSEFIKKWFQVSWSDTSIMKALHNLGEEIQSYYDQVELPKLTSRPQWVLISGDATYYHTYPTGSKKAIWGGLVRSDKQKRRGQRKQTLEKQYCFSTASSEALGDELLSIAQRFRYDQTKSFYSTDGGNDVKGIHRRNFSKTEYILDWNHVSRKLGESLVVLESSADRIAYGDQVRELLWKGRGKIALLLLQQKANEIRTEDLSERQRKRLLKLDEYIQYLENHQDYLIAYEDYQKKGFPIGSSEMEGAIDDLIASRIKKRKGRRFIQDGINGIVWLYCLKLNGDWDSFFDWKSERAA
jgi:transposase-like protein